MFYAASPAEALLNSIPGISLLSYQVTLGGCTAVCWLQPLLSLTESLPPAAYGRNVQQQLVALGLSLVMTLSPALCAFNPAAAQQLPVMDSAAATLAR